MRVGLCVFLVCLLSWDHFVHYGGWKKYLHVQSFFLSSVMGEHLMKHGDGVKDIAFQVEDCDFLVKVDISS